MQLTTERLVLREFLPDDAAPMRAYQQHPAFADAPPAEELVQRFIDWQAEEPRLRYQLAITLADRLIGTCGLRYAEGAYEFGCELDPSFWGRNYAYEACRALLDTGFRPIVAHTKPDNAAAHALALKLGLRQTGPGTFSLA